ncbi:MAG: TonB-dependent receptor [Alistipes sp.]
MQKTNFLRYILTFFLFALPVASLAQGGGATVTVSGIVSAAEDGQPLIGVNVIAGPTQGVSTLLNGGYSIQVASGTVLKFQYIGYKNVEFVVPSGKSSVVHNIALQSDSQSLEEVVVVAYGVRKKGTIAGSVSTVKGGEINDVPTASFDQALQGKSTGLMVLSNSGEPSSPASFQIRGTNSINSGTEPLFILDGISISSNDFSSINPGDIESVSVLKDASSTSIYGARAANGVVVITSKRGRIDAKASVKFRMQLGFSNTASNNWDGMNTAERIQYEHEIGIAGNKNYEELAKVNTDWRKEVFKRTAAIRNYEASVSGASKVFNYFVSGGYFRQEGTALQSDFERYNLRANFEAKAAKWLKLGTSTMTALEDAREADQGEYTTVTPISAAFFMMPYWSPYREDGSIASRKDGTWLGTNDNPLEWQAANPSSYRRYKVISNTFAEIYPVEGLTLRTMFGIDYTQLNAKNASLPSFTSNNGSGRFGRASSTAFNYTITNTINYKLDLNNAHSFNFLLGQEAINNQSESFSVSTRGQNNDKLMTMGTGTTASSWNDSFAGSSYLSFFGRAEYNYRNRYYADASVRGDASSKFGTGSRWGAFWSVGLMWNLRNEKFMERRADWLTMAQVAFSTGTTGNSSIPPYDHLALLAGGPIYNGIAGVAPFSRGNEDLTWEKTWTTNLAFHLGFFNRLNLNVELYNKKTTDMLMAVPVSFSTGFSTQWNNVGAMVNRGAEIEIDADVIRTKDFTWNLSGNVSYNYNEITELYNGRDFYEMSGANLRLEVGHPYGEFYANRYAGVNPANGDALWYTKDGELINEIRDQDKVMLGKSWNAPWQGGFGTTFSWKGLSLQAQFSFVGDRWMMNNDRYFTESNGSFQSYNQSKRLLYDRWKKPGDITDIPRHGEGVYFDSHLIEDASFIRLKNLSLSYTLPASLLKKTHFFESARIYFQAQNLCTWTSFSGLDPESDESLYHAQYPMSRQYSFGLEISF